MTKAAAGQRRPSFKRFFGNLLFWSSQAAVPALSLWAFSSQGIPFELITRDPATSTGMPWYLGGLSILTSSMWAAGAAVCFTAFFLGTPLKLDNQAKSFFFIFGLYTSVLFLDDVLELHEIVYPQIFHITESYAFGSYVVCLCLLIWRFRAVIGRTNFMLLWMSLMTFGLSMCLDILSERIPGYVENSLHYLLEDGSKYTGTAVWVGYFATAARALARPATEETVRCD